MTFPSDEWVRELDERLSATGAGSSPEPLTIQYVVADGDPTAPHGAYGYHLVLGPDADHAVAGFATAPDVTFRLDLETARQIAAGAVSVEEAFLSGHLDLDGDATRLVAAHRASTSTASSAARSAISTATTGDDGTDVAATD